MMKLKKGAVVLFQGDSITDGGRERDGEPGTGRAYGRGYVYLVVARLGVDYAEQNVTYINRGIGGNRVVDLYARWREDALNFEPDVLSILIGVNDVWWEDNKAGVPAEKFEKVYRMLLDETLAARPEVKLILCEPFCGVVKPGQEKMRREVENRGAIVKRLAKEYGAVFVPFQAAFDEACKRREAIYWLLDGVHPSPAGHEVMARAWMSAVRRGRVGTGRAGLEGTAPGRSRRGRDHRAGLEGWREAITD